MKWQSHQQTSQVGPDDSIRKLSTQVQAPQESHPGPPPRLHRPELRVGQPLNLWAYDIEYIADRQPLHHAYTRLSALYVLKILTQMTQMFASQTALRC